MATYEKRGDSWRVKVHKKGRKVSATFPRLAQAQEWAARVEGEAVNRHYGMTTRHTLLEAIAEYRRVVAPAKPGARWEDLRLASFQEREKLLCARQLSSLSESDFAAWRDRRLSEVSSSTVRRELALLGAVLSVARREWKWLSHDPLKIKKPKEPPPRRRGVSHDEIIGILSHARFDVACAFLIALETGMRAGEILSLTWGNVDLAKRVATLPKTKNGDSRQVPLSPTAVTILGNLVHFQPAAVEIAGNAVLATLGPVFTITGKSLDVHFRNARALAVPGCPSCKTLRFHDTRGEFISRAAKSGKFNIWELCSIVGHRDPASIMFYFKASAEELARR